MHGVAQDTYQLGGQDTLQNPDGLLRVTLAGGRDTAVLNVLARTLAPCADLRSAEHML